MVTVVPRRQARGEALAQAIRATGFRKTFIADVASISPSLLSKILSGERTADEDVAQAIASLLKVEIDTVFTRVP